MGLCATVLGMALGSVQPMVMSTLHNITPPARHGEAIALRSIAINLSSTLMPLLFGVAGAAVGAGSLFWGDVGGGRRRQPACQEAVKRSPVSVQPIRT